MTELRILTWHIHGNYLYYLSQIPHIFYLPVDRERTGDYCGAGPGFPWPSNVREIPVEDVKNLSLDCILFQRLKNYTEDQYLILSEKQRRLPRIYLEHDPPQQHPTNTRHPVDDPDVLLVHCTPFNDLMWDSGTTPTMVIDHGVIVPGNVHYTGEKERGIVVINNIARRGRRLGADIYARARGDIPLDLVGMGSEEAGGLGEIKHELLPYFEASYRFFFNPIRYTSLGLAVCEAMMIGMPVIGLATTEMSTVVDNGYSGYVGTDLGGIVEAMRRLLHDPAEARRMGENARRYARERFDIRRFVRDWKAAFALVTGSARTGQRSVSFSGSPAGGTV